MKRAEARQRNTTALLDAALTEMAAHGYAAARLEDIAARAGLTTGAVYSKTSPPGRTSPCARCSVASPP